LSVDEVLLLVPSNDDTNGRVVTGGAIAVRGDGARTPVNNESYRDVDDDCDDVAGIVDGDGATPSVDDDKGTRGGNAIPLLITPFDVALVFVILVFDARLDGAGLCGRDDGRAELLPRV
jgi:hypothetical protein